MRFSRRRLLVGGGAALGLGAAAIGTSAAVCSRSSAYAGLIRPLFVAVADIPSAEDVGQFWRERNSLEEVEHALMARHDLIAHAAVVDPATRLEAIRKSFRTDFQSGDTVVANRWILADSRR